MRYKINYQHKNIGQTGGAQKQESKEIIPNEKGVISSIVTKETLQQIHNLLNLCSLHRQNSIPNQTLENLFYSEGYIKNHQTDNYLHNGSLPVNYSRLIMEMFLTEAGYENNGSVWVRSFNLV